VPAVLPVLDDVADAPPLFVCVNPTVLEFDVVAFPLVTVEAAVPVLEDDDVLAALPPAFVAVFPLVSSLPPLTFPPSVVDVETLVVSLVPVTKADELFQPVFARERWLVTALAAWLDELFAELVDETDALPPASSSVVAVLPSDVLSAVADDELSCDPVTVEVFDASAEPEVTLALAVPALSDVASFVASPPVLLAVLSAVSPSPPWTLPPNVSVRAS
jgi:hypothetical protein